LPERFHFRFGKGNWQAFHSSDLVALGYGFSGHTLADWLKVPGRRFIAIFPPFWTYFAVIHPEKAPVRPFPLQTLQISGYLQNCERPPRLFANPQQLPEGAPENAFGTLTFTCNYRPTLPPRDRRSGKCLWHTHEIPENDSLPTCTHEIPQNGSSPACTILSWPSLWEAVKTHSKRPSLPSRTPNPYFASEMPSTWL
jgi:hypothetical protein